MIRNKSKSKQEAVGLRFAFSACLLSRISIVGPFLSGNESGVLRAFEANVTTKEIDPFYRLKVCILPI